MREKFRISESLFDNMRGSMQERGEEFESFVEGRDLVN